jgi:hypothetical protein
MVVPPHWNIALNYCKALVVCCHIDNYLTLHDLGTIQNVSGGPVKLLRSPKIFWSLHSQREKYFHSPPWKWKKFSPLRSCILGSAGLVFIFKFLGTSWLLNFGATAWNLGASSLFHYKFIKYFKRHLATNRNILVIHVIRALHSAMFSNTNTCCTCIEWCSLTGMSLNGQHNTFSVQLTNKWHCPISINPSITFGSDSCDSLWAIKDPAITVRKQMNNQPSQSRNQPSSSGKQQESPH